MVQNEIVNSPGVTLSQLNPSVMDSHQLRPDYSSTLGYKFSGCAYFRHTLLTVVDLVQ
jgi:hypothetical protein